MDENGRSWIWLNTLDCDGDYQLDVVTEDGRTLRSWTFRVEGGAPVPHGRRAAALYGTGAAVALLAIAGGLGPDLLCAATPPHRLCTPPVHSIV